MAIPAEIKELGDYEKWIHMMIVASPGFGKTVLSGTAPNALFLTTDPEGTISALAFGSKAKEWKIDSWAEFSKAYLYLKNGGIKELGLEWIIIDNISEAQQLGLRESMDNARALNQKLDEFVPSRQDYQRSQNMIRVFVKRFHDLPVNVLWTAWSERNEDAEGDIFYSPAIHGQSGALAQAIAGYMNVVGYGQVIQDANGKDVRRIWFADTGAYKGKDRYVTLGQKMDNPTMPKIATAIEAAKAEMTKRAGAPAPRAKAPAKAAPKTAAVRKPVARKTPATTTRKA